MTQFGNWKVWQDAPEYGCDDNPSYDWIAFEYRNGHWTGRSLRDANREALERAISLARAA